MRLFLILLMLATGATQAALPDTVQGKRVRAFIEAYNTGDEKVYLAMQEKELEPGLLKRRTAEERVGMFRKMRGDFSTMKVIRVVKASAEEIQVEIPTNGGEGVGTFTFSFEKTSPHRIAGLGLQVEAGGGF